MKKIAFVFSISVLVVMASLIVLTAFEQQNAMSAPAVSYDPAAVYTGDYQPDVLLCRNAGSDIWQRIRRLDRIQNVTCPAAIDLIKSQGRWRGRLNLDGSCGAAAEPADWALGNRLNYENLEEQRK